MKFSGAYLEQLIVYWNGSASGQFWPGIGAGTKAVRAVRATFAREHFPESIIAAEIIYYSGQNCTANNLGPKTFCQPKNNGNKSGMLMEINELFKFCFEMNST